MPQLRWTLLCLGVVFIALLVWFERRRQRQASGAGAEQRTTEREPVLGADTTSSGAFREPTLTLPEMRAREPGPPHDLPVVEIGDDSFDTRLSEDARHSSVSLSLPVMNSGPVGTRGRGSVSISGPDAVGGRRVVDRPAMVADDAIGEGEAPGDAADDKLDPGEPRVGEGFVAHRAVDKVDIDLTAFAEPDLPPETSTVADDALAATGPGIESGVRPPERLDIPGAEGVSEARIVEQPAFTLPDVTVVREPIVEWPPDELRRVVALRLVAPSPERLAGRALRLALAAEGFVIGKFSIFHKPDDSGRAVLSAASLSKPGTFDMATMDTQRYGGLSLFAVLPGPKPSRQAFDELLSTARNLNERLQGALQDERGGPLTPTRIASLRETVSAEAPP